LEIKLINLIKKGAEAEIWYGEWFGLEAVFKIRKSKPWRNPLLDNKIRLQRTLREFKIIYECIEAGIDVPYIFDLDLEKFTIIMEYVKGQILKDLFYNWDSKILELCKNIGRIIGQIHNISITHGDVTLSNIILRENKSICLLDFGLAEFSNRIEDKGIDLLIFLRSLESSFSKIAKVCFEEFIKGYSEIASDCLKVIEKMEEIKKRGRYIAERRKVPVYF
jgi:Mn2+-dependent serine/threonine protein kinase